MKNLNTTINVVVTLVMAIVQALYFIENIYSQAKAAGKRLRKLLVIALRWQKPAINGVKELLQATAT